MINDRVAAALGGLSRAVALSLKERRPEIGVGIRMNLVLPSGFGDSECSEGVEAWFESASPAPIGELLCIDLHRLDDLTTRAALGVFLRCAFEPPVIGSGPIRVLDCSTDGLVVLSCETGIDSTH